MKAFFRHYLVDAIFLVVLGVTMLVRPTGTLEAVCRLAGVAVLVMGIAKLILYLAGRKEEPTTTLCLAVVQILLGIALYTGTGFFIGIIPFLFGVLIAYGAIVSLIRAWKLRNRQLGGLKPSVFLSLVTLVLALAVIFHPAAISAIIVQIAGVAMLLEGVTMIMAFSMER